MLDAESIRESRQPYRRGALPAAKQLARQDFSRGDPGPAQFEKRAKALRMVPPAGVGGIYPEFDTWLAEDVLGQIDACGCVSSGIGGEDRQKVRPEVEPAEPAPTRAEIEQEKWEAFERRRLLRQQIKADKEWEAAAPKKPTAQEIAEQKEVERVADFLRDTRAALGHYPPREGVAAYTGASLHIVAKAIDYLQGE